MMLTTYFRIANKKRLILLLLWLCCTPLSAETNETIKAEPLRFLDKEIAAGQKDLLFLNASQSFFGQALHIPVSVAHGTRLGATLCLVAAIHGDELNGIEAVRRIVETIEPENLSGTVIALPVVNVSGFSQGSRYLPDRRDLNRYFPGKRRGSLASRIAYLLFDNIIQHCDYIIDFHTGSFKRTNLPQLRADLSNADIRRFAAYFGMPVLYKVPAAGTLRAAATAQGIPTITFELGEPSTIQLQHVDAAVNASLNVLQHIGLLTGTNSATLPTQTTYYTSQWVRVNIGGMFITEVKLGEQVQQDQVLGTSINPLTNQQYAIRSPVAGTILGMARNQFMLPGFAAFHIGVTHSDSDTNINIEPIESDSSEEEHDD